MVPVVGIAHVPWGRGTVARHQVGSRVGWHRRLRALGSGRGDHLIGVGGGVVWGSGVVRRSPRVLETSRVRGIVGLGRVGRLLA